MSIYMIKYSKKDKTIRLLDSTNKQTKDVPESTLIDFISRGKISIENIKIENKQLKGTNGSIDRYTGNALTVINIIKNQNETIGFELSDCNGNVKKLKYSDCLDAAKKYGLTNAKITSSNGREFISSITGGHESLDVTEVKESINDINLKEKIKQIKTKAIALGLESNKTIYNAIINIDSKASYILKYNEEKDSIQFIDYSVALNYPQYSVYVTDMSWMFSECKEKDLDLSSFDTSNVTNMRGLFASCYAESLDLSSFDTSNVTDMSFMLSECKAQSLDLSSFDTSKVRDMNNMFDGYKAKSLNLSSFNTSNVIHMCYMFSACKVQSLDLSSFDTSNVVDMQNMFERCEAKSINLSSFKTSNVTDMSGMFSECKAKDLDLSSFDTSNVTDMSDIFFDCRAKSIKCSKNLKQQALKNECMAQIEEV